MVLVTKKRNFPPTLIKKIENKKTEKRGQNNEQIHEFAKTTYRDSGTRRL